LRAKGDEGCKALHKLDAVQTLVSVDYENVDLPCNYLINTTRNGGLYQWHIGFGSSPEAKVFIFGKSH